VAIPILELDLILSVILEVAGKKILRNSEQTTGVVC